MKPWNREPNGEPYDQSFAVSILAAPKDGRCKRGVERRFTPTHAGNMSA